MAHPPFHNHVTNTAAIARLNDALRQAIDRPGHDRIVMTAGVAAVLGAPGTAEASARQGTMLAAIRDHEDFPVATDPCGEHDFGQFALFDTRFYWKTDYYDRRLEAASPDAADPQLTCRVLTIMLVEDY